MSRMLSVLSLLFLLVACTSPVGEDTNGSATLVEKLINDNSSTLTGVEVIQAPSTLLLSDPSCTRITASKGILSYKTSLGIPATVNLANALAVLIDGDGVTLVVYF